jgi:hypothetical protein
MTTHFGFSYVNREPLFGRAIPLDTPTENLA